MRRERIREYGKAPQSMIDVKEYLRSQLHRDARIFLEGKRKGWRDVYKGMKYINQTTKNTTPADSLRDDQSTTPSVTDQG
jgi:hypothetical protein